MTTLEAVHESLTRLSERVYNLERRGEKQKAIREDLKAAKRCLAAYQIAAYTNNLLTPERGEFSTEFREMFEETIRKILKDFNL